MPFSYGLAYCKHKIGPAPSDRFAGTQIREHIKSGSREAWQMLGSPGGKFCPFVCDLRDVDQAEEAAVGNPESPGYEENFTVGENVDTAIFTEPLECELDQVSEAGFVCDPLMDSFRVSIGAEIESLFPLISPDDATSDGSLCSWVCLQGWYFDECSVDEDPIPVPTEVDVVVSNLILHPSSDELPAWTEIRFTKERP